MVMMRIVDVIYSLPDMLMVILLSVVLKEVLTPVIEGTFLARLGSNMISLFIVFGLLYWVGMARLVRGQILSIKENEYILAARSIGAKPGRIIKKAHPSELPERYHHFHCTSGAVRNLYRELLKLCRTWCTGADAVTWFSGKRSPRRYDELSA